MVEILIFLTSFFLVIIMAIVKLYFYRLESEYIFSLPAILDLVVFFSLLFVALYQFLKTKQNTPKSIKSGINNRTLGFVFLFLTITALIISFSVNSVKTVVDWDAVALYDARAKFLEDGVKFSEMSKLSEYDNKNQYYYLLYPPYTSIIHYSWNMLFTGQLNVSLIYSLFLFTLGFFVFLVSYKYLGFNYAGIVTFITVAYKDIFSVSLIEYTNLPFSIYIVVGVLLLFDYFQTNRDWKMYLAILLIGSASWIRHLEPIWLAAFASVFFFSYFQKQLKKNARVLIMILVSSVIQYFAWQYFAQKYGNTSNIFEIDSIAIFGSVLGIFTGSFIQILLVFISSWGIAMLINLSSVFTSLKHKNTMLLNLFVLFSIMYYLFSFYFLSFIVDWWREIGSSLVRSAGFLIPISTFCLIWNLKHYIANDRELNLIKLIKKSWENLSQSN